jgi:hypothetical protein
MKISYLRGTVLAASLAMALGLSATAANAATTSHRGGAVTTRAAAPAAAAGTVTAPVTGTFTNSDGTGTFTGSFAPKKFSVVRGTLEATGLLTGTLTNANGTRLAAVSKTITAPVDTGNAADALPACSVLNLVLGPLNLNLLGLLVQLNQVHLTITALPGAGNLLGNLLCAVTNLLNGGGPLSEIAGLLNAILALL